ncbi:unnamed protein product [Moneuplotes crassus]|uniref:LisH domain-containing protein ARMC9 n=2 Tax=Euplotes crassus TaxID=5936 RepID=A0AAD1Y1R1_EUPCR|nr:unnamed protein product [Moneuplotes crassus]
MMNCFSEGDLTKFVSLWNEYVQKESKDINTDKLEFYVRIYFTIYPMHPVNKGKPNEKAFKKRQKEFKKFLDTKGSELSKTSEFLPYYALPYVTDPVVHPSFKELATTHWIQNLEGKLQEFLISQATSPNQSQLAYLFENREKLKQPDRNFEEGIDEQIGEQLAILQQRYSELQQKEQNTKRAFINSQQKWTNFSKNILVIAKQLMGVVDNSDASKSINTIVYKTMKEKIAKYEDSLRKIIEGHSAMGHPSPYQPKPASNSYSESDRTTGLRHAAVASPAGHSNPHSPAPASNVSVDRTDIEVKNSPSIISRDVGSQEADQSVARSHQTPAPVNISFAPLDFDKIKKFLIEAEDEVRVCATLQALRWRISKCRTTSQRNEILHSYWFYDVLGILGDGPDILMSLLNKSRRVLAYTVFLINTMASLPAGRNYLIKHQKILEIIFAVLLSEKSETAIRQQAIVAIQRFSLRSKCQDMIIEMDMIKYVVYILRCESDTLSDYTLEYCTALLMNLTLRNRGKDKCEDPNLELLHVLNELLEHENDQIRTYVNGTLYSIFRRKSIRDQARELGMDEILSFLLQNMQPSEDHIKRQLQYILDQFENDADDSEESSDDEDDIDEQEEDEGEDDDEEGEIIEEGDFDDAISGVPVGEEWLMSEFLAANDEALRQTTTILTKIQEEKKQRALDSTSKSLISEIKRSSSRPVTPTRSNSNIPFISDTYTKSPMRTRNKIPRTPLGGRTAEEGNDFKNEDNSQLDISIGASQNLAGQLAPQFGTSNATKQAPPKAAAVEEEQKDDPPPAEAFTPKDMIPRTPPQMQSKKYKRAPEEEKRPGTKPKKNSQN